MTGQTRKSFYENDKTAMDIVENDLDTGMGEEEIPVPDGGDAPPIQPNPPQSRTESFE